MIVLMKTKASLVIRALEVLLLAALLAGAVSCKTGPAAPAVATPPEPPRNTSALLEKIADLLGKGDYEGALALFDRIDPRDAGKSEIRLLKASACLSAGKTGEARAIAEEVNGAEPSNTQALLVLASVEEALGKEKEQKTLLERVLKLEPANTAALVSMGNIAARNNSFRSAAAYYDQALAADPANGGALLGRAWVYRAVKDHKKAEEFLTKAVELYPRWAAPLHERGRFYKALGYPTYALVDLDKAKAMEPANYWIACDRGDALADLNRKNEALAEFERAVKLNPNYFLAYVYSAGINDELGKYDEAARDYETLIRLNPEYYFAFEGIGMHLMRRGDWLAARDAFLEAYRRSKEKNDESAFGLLAALNWMKGGRPHEPRQFLEEVMRKVQRDSLEYWMLRLYHDLSGDGEIAIRIDKEKNKTLKARMLYYLASYYDIRGNKNLADKCFLQVRELDIKGIPEWRLNEWALEARGLALN